MQISEFKILAALAITLASCAAQIPAADAGNAGMPFGFAARQQAPVVQMEKLKYSPSLAYVPTYTGKGFKNTEAVHYTGLPTGECYNVTYLMREDQTMVHAWYEESLRQCGWTIDEKESKGNCSISASREGGLSCFIYTRPLQKSQYTCEMTLRFSARKS
jgi:hypothetical protein